MVRLTERTLRKWFDDSSDGAECVIFHQQWLVLTEELLCEDARLADVQKYYTVIQALKQMKGIQLECACKRG